MSDLVSTFEPYAPQPSLSSQRFQELKAVLSDARNRGSSDCFDFGVPADSTDTKVALRIQDALRSVSDDEQAVLEAVEATLTLPFTYQRYAMRMALKLQPVLAGHALFMAWADLYWGYLFPGYEPYRFRLALEARRLSQLCTDVEFEAYALDAHSQQANFPFSS